MGSNTRGIGGSGNDEGAEISVSNEGIVYAAGSYSDKAFAGPFSTQSAGQRDYFVAGFQAQSGKATYLLNQPLGSGDDVAYALDVDVAGNLMVAGFTTSSENFSVFGSPIATLGLQDALLIKIAKPAQMEIGSSVESDARWQGYLTPAVDAAVAGTSPGNVSAQPGISLSVQLAGRPTPVYKYSKGAIAMENESRAFSSSLSIPIASASKWWTSALTMRLIESKYLGLDDKISMHLTGLSGDSANVTVRQLLSFTSGVGSNSCIYNDNQPLAECAALILASPRANAPGEKFNYSGTHMQVLGAVILSAMSKAGWSGTINDLYSQFVGNLLGTTASTFYTSNANLNKWTPSRTPANPLLAGGMFSNVDDYMKLMGVYQNGGKLENGNSFISPAGVDLILSNQRGNVPVGSSPLQSASSKSPRGEAFDFSYGLGNWLEIIASGSAAGARRGNSSPGAFGWYPYIDQNFDYAVVIGAKKSTQDSYNLMEIVRARIVDILIDYAPSR